jgi:hypothetical protein
MRRPARTRAQRATNAPTRRRRAGAPEPNHLSSGRRMPERAPDESNTATRSAATSTPIERATRATDRAKRATNPKRRGGAWEPKHLSSGRRIPDGCAARDGTKGTKEDARRGLPRSPTSTPAPEKRGPQRQRLEARRRQRDARSQAERGAIPPTACLAPSSPLRHDCPTMPSAEIQRVRRADQTRSPSGSETEHSKEEARPRNT